MGIVKKTVKREGIETIKRVFTMFSSQLNTFYNETKNFGIAFF